MEMLGVSVGFIHREPTLSERQAVYSSIMNLSSVLVRGLSSQSLIIAVSVVSRRVSQLNYGAVCRGSELFEYIGGTGYDNGWW